MSAPSTPNLITLSSHPALEGVPTAIHNIQLCRSSDPALWARLEPVLDQLARDQMPPQAEQYQINPKRYYVKIYVQGRDEVYVLAWVKPRGQGFKLAGFNTP